MPRSTASDTENGSPEKEAAMHLERRPANGLSFEEEDFLANFSDDERKAVLRKVPPTYSITALLNSDFDMPRSM